ncbi:uncharacterized protein L3040_005183 [Drepanopeziza brunnea f. sp. 'multigermtubi']|uniref:uncharacterized protein n=1 Tax=Drepanopeziza brunnea f. sp. 'multigermtubi' TaxID=698441 RepID=UPI0023A69600|nr:hypothetical protein L3040_005183 [Drepanopeziza brunnea f. sp. 'multigermtubi']
MYRTDLYLDWIRRASAMFCTYDMLVCPSGWHQDRDRADYAHLLPPRENLYWAEIHLDRERWTTPLFCWRQLLVCASRRHADRHHLSN